MNSIDADGWAVERDLTLETATLRESALARIRPCRLISVGSAGVPLLQSIRGHKQRTAGPRTPSGRRPAGPVSASRGDGGVNPWRRGVAAACPRPCTIRSAGRPRRVANVPECPATGAPAARRSGHRVGGEDLEHGVAQVAGGRVAPGWARPLFPGP